MLKDESESRRAGHVRPIKSDSSDIFISSKQGYLTDARA